MINYIFKQQIPQSLEDFILERKGSIIQGHLDIRISETLTDKEPHRDFKTIDMLINIDFNKIDILWIKQHEKYDLPLGKNLFDSETILTFNWVSNTYSLNGTSKSDMNSPEAIISLEQFSAELDIADFQQLTVYKKPSSDDYILSSSNGIATDTKFVIFDIEEFHRGVLRELREKGKKPYFSSQFCLQRLIGRDGMKTRCFDSYSDMFDMINTSGSINSLDFLLVEIELKKIFSPTNI